MLLTSRRLRVELSIFVSLGGDFEYLKHLIPADSFSFFDGQTFFQKVFRLARDVHALLETQGKGENIL